MTYLEFRKQLKPGTELLWNDNGNIGNFVCDDLWNVTDTSAYLNLKSWIFYDNNDVDYKTEWIEVCEDNYHDFSICH